MTEPRTLAEKVWEGHVVRQADGEPDLLYIDMHLVHEVTSPQAFDGLRLAGRGVRRPDLTVATMDHNVPTTGWTCLSRTRSRLARWKCSRPTAKNSASGCSLGATPIRASSTSLDPNWGSPNPA